MGLALQPAARRDLVDIAVNVDLQQRARMIGWTSGRFWNHTVKAQRPEIQLIDKHVDHPHRVVLSNVVIQILGKQNALSTDFTLDEARHLTPPARIIQNYNSTGVFTQPRSEAEIQTETLPDSRLLWTNQFALLGLANPESQPFTTACSGQSASSLSKWMPVLVRVRSALLSGCFGVRDDLRCS